MFMKCGRPVMLNYYRVDESLWRDQQQLVRLSKYSLTRQNEGKHSRSFYSTDSKDPPQYDLPSGTLLNESGIKDENMLRILGAKRWLRLRHKAIPC